MCVLIKKPAGKAITKDELKNCWKANPDGGGFAYVNVDVEGVSRIKIKKSMSFDDFYERLRVAERDNPDSMFLIHMRIATLGSITPANCHPFRCSKERVFGHNGVITKMNVKAVGDESDTRAFNRLILRVLKGEWDKCEATKVLIEDYIGPGSKLVVLNIDNTATIYNEDKGTWHNDVWYSNTSYKKPVAFYSKGYYGNYEWKGSIRRKSFTKKNNNNNKGLYKTGAGSKPKSLPLKSVVYRSPKESKEETNPFNEIFICDCCRESYDIFDTFFFSKNTGGFEIYCRDCREDLLKELFITPDSEITAKEGLELLNKERGEVSKVKEEAVSKKPIALSDFNNSSVTANASKLVQTKTGSYLFRKCDLCGVFHNHLTMGWFKQVYNKKMSLGLCQECQLKMRDEELFDSFVKVTYPVFLSTLRQ